ncbi:HV05 protein, partial [Atractosteus spatula]|nr:HV05 protein [Atractosteus spatula]
LTQPASAEVKKPGESLKLSCQVSGFQIDSNWKSWIRQAPGKGLEWLLNYYSGSSVEYSPTIQGRFTPSIDTSSSTFFLQMNDLRAEDTAVYYCVKYTVTRLNQEAVQKPALRSEPLYTPQETSKLHVNDVQLILNKNWVKNI